MNLRSRSIGIGTALACVGASLLTFAAPASAATITITKTLNLHCTFPIIGSQPVTVALSMDVPTTATVGVPITVTNVTAVQTVSGAVAGDMALVGAATVVGANNASGTPLTTAQVTINDAGTSTNLTLPVTLPSTPVPSNGTALVINGTLPDSTFTPTAAGTLSLAASGSISSSLHVYNSSGGTIAALGDPVTTPCTFDAGQNLSLGSITVAPASTPTPTPTTSAPSPSPTATTTAPSSSPTGTTSAPAPSSSASSSSAPTSTSGGSTSAGGSTGGGSTPTAVDAGYATATHSDANLILAGIGLLLLVGSVGGVAVALRPGRRH